MAAAGLLAGRGHSALSPSALLPRQLGLVDEDLVADIRLAAGNPTLPGVWQKAEVIMIIKKTGRLPVKFEEYER
jgi:hypothetical protein